METIYLKKLTLRNFKGVRELVIEDFKNVTGIFGDNGTGKTTVFDAFTYLFFGKDSSGSTKFQVKTLDSQNNVIPKLEHEVSGIIVANGKEIEIRRILKEKWVKKRGALIPEFAGNETLFYWNDVPKQANEFQTKINELLDEGVFKLITNPLFFNSLKWQDRREVLIRIAGEFTNNDVAAGNAEFIKLIAGLQDKTIEEYKKEIASRKKKLNVDLKAIPTRVDEAQRGMPELIDFDQVRKEIISLEGYLANTEEAILDKSKGLEKFQESQSKITTEIHVIKTKLQGIEFEEKEKLHTASSEEKAVFDRVKRELSRKKDDVASQLSYINAKEQRIETLTTRKNKLVDNWENENAKVFSFNEDECACPTCKRTFESADIQKKKSELESNFNKNKLEQLTLINEDGKNASEELKNEEGLLVEAKEKLDLLLKEETALDQTLKAELEKQTASTEVVSLNTILAMNAEYKTLKSELVVLEGKIIETPKVDNSELLENKKKLVADIDELKKKLTAEATIKKTNERITELESEESQLSQQISDLEKEEFLVEGFIKSKIETLENKINKKFKHVKFKLFETQINGGEIECCETLVDGVPFSDLNTASKINAGLDIINALSQFHKVSAPIFIDNRESINELIESDSQLVNLIVSKDPKLRVA
ncbi:recombinase RecF [Bacteroidota bacterium]